MKRTKTPTTVAIWTVVAALVMLFAPSCSKKEGGKSGEDKKPAKESSAKGDGDAAGADTDKPAATDNGEKAANGGEQGAGAAAKGGFLPVASVYVKHRVKDYSKWKAAFDAHSAARAEAGIVWHIVARDPADEHTVIFRGGASDLEKLKAFVSSEDLKKVMADAGVEGKPEIWLANNADLMPPKEDDAGRDRYAIIVQHEVEDYDTWKKAFDARLDARKEASVFAHIISRNADNPNSVIVTAIAYELDKVSALLSDEATKKAMKDAGVKGEPVVWAAKTDEWYWTGMPGMKTAVVAHEVEDFDKWKAAFDAHAGARKAAGVMGHWVGRADGDENRVIVAAWGGPGIADFLNSPDLGKVMKEAGVKGKPEVWLLNPVDGVVWPSEGENNAALIVKHDVEDFAKWKAAYDGHSQARAEAGAVRVGVSRAVDNDKTVVIWGTGHDLAKFKAFLGSPDLGKAMKEAGVVGEPTVWLARTVEFKMHK